MKEKLSGEFYPSMKSKHRVTIICLEHTRPVNQRRIEAFLKKLSGGSVKVMVYKNGKVSEEGLTDK